METDSKLNKFIEININLKFNNNENKFKINILCRDFPLTPPIIYFENFNINNKHYLNNCIYIIPDVLPKNWDIKTKLSKVLEKIFENINTELINNNVTYETNTLENVLVSYDEFINKNKLYVN